MIGWDNQESVLEYDKAETQECVTKYVTEIPVNLKQRRK